MGGVKYGGETDLKKKGIFTRQFWAIEDIEVGDEISFENIKSIRAPADANGIRTKEYKNVIGKKARNFISKHSPLTRAAIEG